MRIAAVALAVSLGACIMPPQQQQGMQQQPQQQQQAGMQQPAGTPQQPAGQQVAYQAQAQTVTVNGTQLTAQELEQLAQNGLPLPSGQYWYDRMCGAFGQIGGPTALFIWPNLQLGGQLQPTASNGTSNIFINGRNITASEAQFLAQTVGQPVQPGRYWLDAQGNAGQEGGPAQINLVQAAQQRGGGGNAGGQAKFQKGWGGTYSSDGNCYYISTDAGSVMGPNC